MGNRGKMLVVGWDGATFDVIRPMLERGELPNLARLIDGGARGPLRSTMPPSSAVAWSTFMTGRAPANHGIFGFYRSNDHAYRARLIDSRDLDGPRFWDWLGEAGYRTGVINVPLTYPPRPLNGFLVGGMLTPGAEEIFTYPTDLTTHLRDGRPPFPIEAQEMRRVRAHVSSPEVVLDLLAGDPVARRFEKILGTIDDEDEAVVVDSGQISRPERTVPKALPCAFRVPPVAEGDAVPPGDDFADLSGPYRLTAVIKDLQFDAGDTAPYRARLAVKTGGVEAGETCCRFRLTVHQIVCGIRL